MSRLKLGLATPPSLCRIGSRSWCGAVRHNLLSRGSSPSSATDLASGQRISDHGQHAPCLLGEQYIIGTGCALSATCALRLNLPTLFQSEPLSCGRQWAYCRRARCPHRLSGEALRPAHRALGQRRISCRSPSPHAGVAVKGGRHPQRASVLAGTDGRGGVPAPSRRLHGGEHAQVPLDTRYARLMDYSR